jgi:hypothetical protein
MLFIWSLFILFLTTLACHSRRTRALPLYFAIAVDTSLSHFQNQLQCLQSYAYHGITLIILINNFSTGQNKALSSSLQQHIQFLKTHRIPFYLFFTSLHSDSLRYQVSTCDSFLSQYFHVIRDHYLQVIPPDYHPEGIVLGDRWPELEKCKEELAQQLASLKSAFPQFRYSWLGSLHWWEANGSSPLYDFIALEYPDPPVRRPENAVPVLNRVIQKKLGKHDKPVWIGRIILLGKHAQAKWEKLQTEWDPDFPLIGVNLFTLFPYFSVCDSLSPLQLDAPWLKKDENPPHSP